jgi:SAM-dependent methyltransferase
VFEGGQFDLVVGGSVLHHLLAPELCLRECARVLRPGGYAVFFEPFEAGNQVMALLMRQLITLNGFNSAEPLPEPMLRFFNAMLLDYTTRKDLVPGHHLLPYLDDKWLFSRSLFETLADDAGFAKLQICSLQQHSRHFWKQMHDLLTIGAGLSMDDLPTWALPVIEQFDAQFSPQAQADLMFEGAVVLQR